jgi:hypothetical protein
MAKKRSRLDDGIAFARKEMQCNTPMDRMARRYAIICNLIETLWCIRSEKEYWKVDYKNLAPLVSPQSRDIATFIESLFEDECIAYEEVSDG